MAQGGAKMSEEEGVQKEVRKFYEETIPELYNMQSKIYLFQNFSRLVDIRLQLQQQESAAKKVEFERATGSPLSGLSIGYQTMEASSPPASPVSHLSIHSDEGLGGLGGIGIKQKEDEKVKGGNSNGFLDSLEEETTETSFTLMDKFNSPLFRLKSCDGPKKTEEELNEEDAMRSLREAIQLSKPRRVPPVYYVCHSCGVRGHFIQDCPRKDATNHCTPYRGHKLCFGEFECEKCKRKWSSAKSEAGKGQFCAKCRVEVMPKKQYSLEKAIALGKMTATGEVAKRGKSAATTYNSLDISACSDLNNTAPILPTVRVSRGREKI